MPDRNSNALPHDPLWFKHAVIYQLHVRAFMDSNANGVGDFQGLTQKLDYLQDLGVTALWLLPFYPSPLKDDGYDIADYTGVHPSYGSVHDVKRFIAEAHARGLRVITELVINHTSDQHAWFQKARRAPKGSKARDFYVWSDSPEKYPGVRIIFQDFEPSNWTWDSVAGQYYWHRFFSHQPDLNFDNPEVHRAVFKVMDQWFALGVDGMRLDAVPYLYEREGTNCENLPETHQFLKKLRRHMDDKWPGSMLLAEANQWPEDAVHYFGDGDECHMCFNFPVMPRLFMGIQMEDSFPIIDIMQQTPAIPGNCQWAVFLRNHDELTLEMVTDEERDYMYRAYASNRQARINLGIRRRLAPLLNNHRRKIELMNGLLFSLPGTPIVYYGDEIGMGDNVYLGDRNGVRTPMQWTGDRNAGFSRCNPQQLYLPVIIDPEYHYETVNVEAQQQNPSSLLWWMKRLIALRKRHPVFGDGEIEFLASSNPKILAFLRKSEQEQVLVVANMSRFAQCAEFDLARVKGFTPVELFGSAKFPVVGEGPYFLSLGPHSFYWFLLKAPKAAAVESTRETPLVALRDGWDLSTRGARAALEPVLAADLPSRRWFSAKARTIRSTQLIDVAPIPMAGEESDVRGYLALMQVAFTEGEAQTYAIPLALAEREHATRILGAENPAFIARVRSRDAEQHRILYDAMADPAFATALLQTVSRRRKLKSAAGEIDGSHSRAVERRALLEAEKLEPRAVKLEQSNSTVFFGDRYILKLFRRLEPGLNPDLEIGRGLTEAVHFPHTPPLAGAIEYQGNGGEPLTVAMLQGFVPNQGDAWTFTLHQVGQFYEAILASPSLNAPESRPMLTPLERLDEKTPEVASEMFGHFLSAAALLGQRTAEMHRALASIGGDKAFAPEPFTQLYQRSLYQSLRSATRQTFSMLRSHLKTAPDLRPQIDPVLAQEQQILEIYNGLTRRQIVVDRIRHHGDYHLGQVLYTGKDFVIIDFEGEPARPLGERRIKRCVLRDVAGMLRSFEYAAYVGLQQQVDQGAVPPERTALLEPWAQFWSQWVGVEFVRSYLAAAAGAAFLPRNNDDMALLLRIYLLEKVIYELGYELNNRPRWVSIPLRGVIQLLGAAAQGESKVEATT